MRTAYTRTIEVKGRRYVQAVQYSDFKSDRPEDRKFRVLHAFGLESPESYMRAELYVAAYNKLAEVVRRGRWAPNTAPFSDSALAVFGLILGKDRVEEMLRV